MPVQPIPEGYPRVTPYLCTDGAAAAIDFYTSVLGAEERVRMDAPGGKIGHAELALGNSVVMLADEFPDIGFRSPRSVGGTPITLHVYVADVDAVFAEALARARSNCPRSRTSSTATAPASSRTRSATAGASRRTSRTYRRRRWRSGPRRH